MMSHTLIETTLRMPRVCAGIALNAATPAIAAYGGGLHLWRMAVAAPMLAATWPSRSAAGLSGDAPVAAPEPAAPRPVAKAAPKPAAKPAPRPAATAVPQPAAEAAPQPAAKAAVTAKPKPAAKPAPKPAEKAAPQPAAKSAPQPAAKPASRPAKASSASEAKPAPQPVPAEPAESAASKPAKPVAAAPAPAKPDDLTRIKGVGPKIAAQLATLGVTRFDQVAAWTGPQIDRFDDKLDGPAGRIRRDDWIGQARALSGLDEAPKPARPSTTTYQAPNKAGRSGAVTLPAMPDGTPRHDT